MAEIVPLFSALSRDGHFLLARRTQITDRKTWYRFMETLTAMNAERAVKKAAA